MDFPFKLISSSKRTLKSLRNLRPELAACLFLLPMIPTVVIFSSILRLLFIRLPVFSVVFSFFYVYSFCFDVSLAIYCYLYITRWFRYSYSFSNPLSIRVLSRIRASSIAKDYKVPLNETSFSKRSESPEPVPSSTSSSPIRHNRSSHRYVPVRIRMASRSGRMC